MTLISHYLLGNFYVFNPSSLRFFFSIISFNMDNNSILATYFNKTPYLMSVRFIL